MAEELETKTEFSDRLNKAEELAEKNGKADFDMTSVDGNAFSLMGHWQRAARRGGWPKEDIDEVLELCKAGPYDELVTILMTVSD